ncbi:hypothetical protein HELRODRAFT_159812 [Helobdella robusta]|uniref:BTB domain-containing protein n=1 Tax=Helobdella robusta TaxID=6412 RepID=T1EPF3_HELRO|nr:hypothetical protein HELRODRAFT_159812 [Helobdella robusta]ESO13181.1 hypothetical protein HELRODRAFT_159812 [Helobdella robusta]
MWFEPPDNYKNNNNDSDDYDSNYTDEDIKFNDQNSYESYDDSDSYEEYLNLTREIVPQKHSMKVLQLLQNDRKDSSTNSLDMKIKVTMNDSTEFLHVHKFLISSCCPYVKSYLVNMPKTDDCIVDMTGLNGESVSVILDWIYTGVCKITSRTAIDILVSADFLCIDDVVKLAADFLSHNLSYENCLEVYMLSICYETFGIFRDRVYKYMLCHFYTLLSQCYLDDLPVEKVLELSSDDGLILFCHKFVNLESSDQEIKLFEVVKSYLERKNLQSYWLDFLTKSIRLGFLVPDQIKNLIDSSQGWLGDCCKKDECVLLLQDLYNKKKQEDSISESQYPIWSKPRIVLKGFNYNRTRFIAIVGYRYEHNDNFGDNTSEDNDLMKRGSLLMIRRVKIFLREWDDIIIIGGIEASYSDNRIWREGLNEETVHGAFEFTLKDDEFINKVEYTHGHMLDSITFYTNLENKYGPYGGVGGGFGKCKPRKKRGFLAAMFAETITDRDLPTIRYLSFYWGVPSKHLKSYFA